MKRIDRDSLRDLSARAAGAPRRRANLNLHASHDESVQRLLNALEPGTYVRPHRHDGAGHWELLALLSGAVEVLVFDDHGRVTARFELEAGGALPVVELPGDTWHTLAAPRPGTVLLEVKAGPYVPGTGTRFADWAPPEAEAGAARLEQWLRAARVGERYVGR